jgi:hypothetical protein
VLIAAATMLTPVFGLAPMRVFASLPGNEHRFDIE